MSRSNANSERKVRHAKNMELAMEYRRMGFTYEQIGARIPGDQAGRFLGKSQACRLVKDGMAEARATLATVADVLKAEDLSRLDGLLQVVYLQARGGNLLAVDRVLRILERRAQLIGYDAPLKQQLTGVDGGPLVVKHEGVDYSAFTDEELTQARSLVKAAADRVIATAASR